VTVFDRFRDLVRGRIGIELPGQSRRSIESFVSSRCQARGYPSVEDYFLSLAAADPAEPELQELVGTVTNGKTSFFRHPRQLAALTDLVLTLVRRGRRELSIWCAACSTGEEAYSVAIELAMAGIESEVLGTDVSKAAIDVARRGEYGGWTLRGVSEQVRQRYFVGIGERDGRFLVAPQIQKRITFSLHNLIREAYPRPKGHLWDIVLCRNVFIYFSHETITSILDRLTDVLNPGGHLFVGGTESLHGVHPRFALVRLGDSFAYRLLEPGGQGTQSFFATPELRSPGAGSAGPPVAPRDALGQAAPEPPVTPGAQIRAALDAYERGDRPGAKALLQAHLERSSTDVAARVTMGNILLMERDLSGAEEQYSAALDVDPLSAEAHFFLGVLYRKARDDELAIDAFRRTLFLDSSFWVASFYLAGLYSKAGRWQKARQAYENTLRTLCGPVSSPLMQSFLHGMDDMARFRSDVRAACESNLVGFRVAPGR